MSSSVRSALTVTAVALLLAACGFGRPASPTPSDSSGPSSQGGNAAGGPSGTAALPSCQGRDFVATVVAADSTDHTPRWTLTLTDNSGRTCRTRGWVGLDVI